MADLDLDAIEAAAHRGVAYVEPTTVLALVAEVRRLRTIAEWAKDAPHHDGCRSRFPRSHSPVPCTCGRDEVMSRG